MSGHSAGAARPNQTVVRTFDVLRAIGRSPRPVGVSELASGLWLPKATVHRILKTLEAMNTVTYDETSKTYRLGPTLIELGNLARSQLRLVQIARPVLERLAEEVGETVNIGIMHQTQVLILDTIHESSGRRLTVNLGPIAELHCSALGKAILSALPPRTLDDLLPQLKLRPITAHTIQDLEELKRELEQVRQTRIAYDREETEIGLVCVGTVVGEGAGAPAISVSGPRTRMEGERLRLIEEATLAAADRLASLLAYT